MANSTPSKIKSFCNVCKRESTQHVVARHHEHYSNEEDGIWLDIEYETLKCGGCENVSFREVSTSSEDRDYETGDFDPTIRLYPEPNRDKRSTKPFVNVPWQIREVYGEILESFNHRAPLLCAGGIRAILEAIAMHEKITDGPVEFPKKGGGTQTKRTKDLRGKIEGMFEKGLIAKDHRDALHEHRFLGNEALHEIERPASEELVLALDIVEHTLEHLYEIRIKAAGFKTLKLQRLQKKQGNTPRRVLKAIPSAPLKTVVKD